MKIDKYNIQVGPHMKNTVYKKKVFEKTIKKTEYLKKKQKIPK